MSTLQEPTRDDQGTAVVPGKGTGAVPRPRTSPERRATRNTAVRWSVYALAGVLVAAVGVAGVTKLNGQQEGEDAPAAAADSNLALKNAPIDLPASAAGLSGLGNADVTQDPAWKQQAKKAAGGAVLAARTYGQKNSNHIVRVVAARADLTGGLELAWAADAGQKVGAVSCTNKTRLTPDQPPRVRPTLMLCWRTSPSLSVYTLVVDPKATSPVPTTDAAATVDAVWRSASNEAEGRNAPAPIPRPPRPSLTAVTDSPAGPLAGTLVVDLTRALAGPHAAMMLGDLGARVDEGRDARQRRRHPRLGTAVRRPPGRRPVESTYFLSCNRNKESVTLDLKIRRRASPARRAGRRGPTCCWRTSGPACSTGSALPSSGCRAQSGAGDPLDQRVRPRRPRGRPAGVRPDRPGRGRPDVADRLGTGRPAACRRPHRRPARRDVRRVRGAWRHCTSGPGPGADRSSGRRCSRRSSACTPSRAPGRRWRARSAAPRATTTRRSARTGSSTAPTAPCSSHRQRGVVAAVLRRVRARPGRRRAWRRTPTGWRTASGSSRCVEAASRRGRWRLLPRLAEIGIPAGSVRTLDEVYDWDQTRSQGLLVPVEHATLGPLELPGPPLRFFATGGTEVTRRSHEAPPTLGSARRERAERG